jgi:GlpG protein
MRLIGHIEGEAQANLFSDYLSSLEIRSSVEPDTENQFAIWIFSEDQVDVGKKHLAEFLAHPSDPKFAVGAKQGEKFQAREREAEAKLSERVYTRDNIWPTTAIGPVTLALIVISVGVFLYTGFASGSVFAKVHGLFISEQVYGAYLKNTELAGLVTPLPEVRQGQVWRLITPIFVHFGILHIVFNMIMLRDLGTMVEVRRGTWTFIGLVVVFGVISNLTQYYFKGPGFGGMSGVLYGLFGYIWMRQRWDPSSGLYLSQQAVASMLIWFVLCLVGVIPNVANEAHAGGLAAGVVFGALPLLWSRR